MSVKLLTEHYLEFLSLKGGCTGWSESTLVKMPHCWKSHVTAHICYSMKGDIFTLHIFKTKKLSQNIVHCISVWHLNAQKNYQGSKKVTYINFANSFCDGFFAVITDFHLSGLQRIT